ncbi:MAG: protein phosphatase CheZ [Alphaproteobacteria bacterium]|nr:protein phosphatase CheZ [Alphaproteobacteria bacterium]
MTEPSKKTGRAFGRDQVIKIITSVINKVEHAEGDTNDAIYMELRVLHSLIEEARREVGFARPGDINNKYIPGATDELDAVVEATAGATGAIMDSCEAIEGIAAEIGGDASAKLIEQVTKIYEACSFQDITGQRIKKVITALKAIEEKVNNLMRIVGEKLPGIEESGSQGAAEGDAALLNGPQLPGKGINQDEIDKLLSQFD